MTTAYIAKGKPFDGYEIAPCAFYTHPSGDEVAESFETLSEALECADETGGYIKWTLYGHREGEGVEAIADFGSPYEAAYLLASILNRSVEIGTMGRTIISLSAGANE